MKLTEIYYIVDLKLIRLLSQPTDYQPQLINCPNKKRHFSLNFMDTELKFGVLVAGSQSQHMLQVLPDHTRYVIIT